MFLKIYFGETQIKSAKQFAGSFGKKTLQLEAHAASKKKDKPIIDLHYNYCNYLLNACTELTSFLIGCYGD